VRRQLLVLTGILVILGLGLGSYFLFIRESSPIPQSVQKSVSFPLYYPDKLPDNWAIDKTSFSKGTDVVFYKINDSHQGRVISVSIQPQPEAFNFDNFYKKTLAKSIEFTTPLGQAAVGEGENNLKIGSLATGDSWVLVTADSQKIKTNEIRTILSALKN